MKRITVVCLIVLLSLSVVQLASAESPVFQIRGHMSLDNAEITPLGPGSTYCDPGTWKHVKLRGLEAYGTVTFFDDDWPADGTSFYYSENINVNPDEQLDDGSYTASATEQGNMTLTLPDGSQILVRFVGSSDLAIVPTGEDEPPYCIFVSASVQDQPWTVKGGKNAVKGVHGGGTRSTDCDAPDPYGFCVSYYGDIEMRP